MYLLTIMVISLRCIVLGNFFNNLLVENSDGSYKSYLSNPDYSGVNTNTMSAVIGVLTVAIIISVVLATVLFHKKNSQSKMNSFFQKRVGALKKLSRKFDNNFSFSSDEGEISSARSVAFDQQNSDRESPGIQYTSVDIIRL